MAVELVVGTDGGEAAAVEVLVQFLETGILSDKPELHFAQLTVTMLGNVNDGIALWLVRGIHTVFVILRTIDEHHHIGVLLDGARFAQVGKDGLFRAGALLHATAEL